MQKKLITVFQFQQWHPEKLICDTDAAYTKLANAIFAELEPWLEFMEPQERPGVAIGLAHYIEDIISGTHQMEVFMKLYKQMYGYDLPFFDDDREQLECNKMRFVLWHCICGQRDGRFINPVTGTDMPAQKLMHFIDDARTKYGCTPNEDLAGYLYSEEILEDAILVKSVLMWIEYRSFLGRWQDNDPKNDPFDLQKLFPQMNDHMVSYGNGSMQAFSHQAWPLSLPAQHIYAEMIRTDVDDPEDEMAKDVEEIKYRDLGMCHGLKVIGGSILMEDCRGEQFLLDGTSGDINLLKTFKTRKYIMGAFFEYRGLWNVCGVNGWMDMTEKDFREVADKEAEFQSLMHGHEHQYDDFLEKQGGRKMFYFKNFSEYEQWLKKELGVKNGANGIPAEWRDANGVVVFFEANGQTTISIYPELITDTNNPYYDEDKAEQGQLELVANTERVSPGFLEYALAHDMLPLAAMNDRRGAEYGWQIFQNNIEFIARCFRRDIKNPDVFCPRKNYEPSDCGRHDDQHVGVMSKEQFIKELHENTFIRSKAAKIWHVVKANKSVVSVQDDYGKTVTMNTNDIYKAYFDLWGTGNYSTADVAPYMSKNQLSAATAIIYTLCGNGMIWRNLNKLFEDHSLAEVAEMICNSQK